MSGDTTQHQNGHLERRETRSKSMLPRDIEQEVTLSNERKILTRLTRHPPDPSPFCHGEGE